MPFCMTFQGNSQQNASAMKSAKGKTGEQAVFSTCCRDETSTYYDRAKCQVARKCPNHGVHQRKSRIKRLYFSPCCGNTAFSPVFPSAESIAKEFCWLCLWNFKEKAPTILWHSLKRPKRLNGFRSGGLAVPCDNSGPFPSGGYFL